MSEAPAPNQIICGDALEVMRGWPDAFVQCCVTSPPYWGLRDYGVAGQLGLERTPDEYVAKMVEVFREVRRVMKEDGVLWLNVGDSYATGGHGGHQASTKGALPISFHGHRPRHGDRIPRHVPPNGLKPKDLVGVPWMLAFALRADGWYLRRDIIWSKPNGMPESVTDRPTSSHEYIFILSKSERYFYDAEAIKEPATYLGPNGKQHSPYAQGFQRRTTEEEQERRSKKQDSGYRRYAGFNRRWAENEAVGLSPLFRNKRSVWTVATEPFPEAHFATFPQALIEPCILAGSRPGDIVLDPFMGAGTVGLVAARYNRKFLGIELNPAYVKMAEARIAPELAQGKML